MPFIHRCGWALVALLFLTPALTAQSPAATNRRPWAEVLAPSIVSAAPKAGDPGRLAVTFRLVTATDGADRATVELLDAKGAVIETRPVGKTKSDSKSVEFAPRASGSYTIRVQAFRTGEASAKISPLVTVDFRLPLARPVVSARNLGGGAVILDWPAVPEATDYLVEWTNSAKPGQSGNQIIGSTTAVAGADLHTEIRNLAVDGGYDFTITARRGNDRTASAPLHRTVRSGADRQWQFTRFGQSSSDAINSMTMLDADNLRFKLNSCSVLPDGQIDQKGGKFTTFHDGVSFYYTIIDPAKENFELTATFTLDYINPTPDGQEGFGLLAMDNLGAHGVSSVNHYTNSAGIIATKFEATVDGVKKTSKDTLGARFVSGITPEVLRQGDSAIAQNGKNLSMAFSYATDDLVKAGQSYVLTLKKTNTGYQTSLRRPGSTGNMDEFIMYGAEKLAQLDPAHDYVGFAVARGCNVTVSDVTFRTSNPAADPVARKEPAEPVALEARVDSPITSSSPDYRLVFNANAPGRLTIKAPGNRILVDNAPIILRTDFTKEIRLESGQNVFELTFTPESGYRPGPRQVLAIWNPGLSAWDSPVGPVTLRHSVTMHRYTATELYVAPTGRPLGQGTPQSPLDIETALAFAAPGQAIVLAGGIYLPSRSLIIARGNNGTPASPKILRAAGSERPILDFSQSTGGMQLWGDWWTIDGIDVCNTPGNVKGLQVAGNHNIVSNVRTYRCGDTGLQISGMAAEAFARWPANNLVLNCESWGNSDPAANNADGFAAKLTCGEGNVFRGCVAFSNIDDGWDLFSKIESGPIGAVVIEDCLAYRNGSLPDGSGNGDGNGFKLGGDGISVPHRLRNSIAFANGSSGITSNSDPVIIVENCTSFGNKGSNINLYGKGNGARLFTASKNLSMKGGSGDVYNEMPELATPDNFFWNGAQCRNSNGDLLGPDIFEQTDLTIVPGRRPDGSIDLKGLLVPNQRAPAGIGARLP